MKLLLDSCTFLWLISDYEKIPKKTRQKIADLENEVYLSSISVAEILLKASKVKLDALVKKPYADFIIEQRIKHRIDELPFSENDLRNLEKLPLFHNDPFDRFLISQAISNSATIITPDSQIVKYPLNVLW